MLRPLSCTHNRLCTNSTGLTFARPASSSNQSRDDAERSRSRNAWSSRNHDDYEDAIIGYLANDYRAFRGPEELRPIAHPGQQTPSVASLDLSDRALIPDHLRGPELMDHFQSVFNNEKRWLKNLVKSRLKLLDQMDILIQDNIVPFTFHNAEQGEADTSILNQTGANELFTYREMMYDMATHNSRVQRLQSIAERYGWKVNRWEHQIVVVDRWTEEVYIFMHKVNSFKADVNKIEAWTDSNSNSQPSQIIRLGDGNLNATQIIEKARLEARQIAKRLQ